MNIRHNINRLHLVYQGRKGLTPTDFLFCSYPRSGSTWMRFILCNILFLSEENGNAVDFHRLNETMVEYGVNDLRPAWQYSTLPRFVKTHWSYSASLFGKTPSVGIVRDPRDVMLSFYRYQEKFVGKEVSTFSEFIRHPKEGLPAWFAHYNSWKDRWGHTVRYEALRQNSAETITSLCNFVQTPVDASIIAQAIERADIRNVQKLASQVEATSKDAQFAKSGKSTWQERFSAEDLSYYHTLCDQYQVDLYR